MNTKFKNQIIRHLEEKSLSFIDLIHDTKVPTNEAEEILDDLQDQGVILFDGKKYVALKNVGLKLGTIVTRKTNFAFIRVAGIDHDLRLTGKYLLGLIVGDRIYIKPDAEFNNAHFSGFYKRPSFLIGTLTKKPRKGYYLKSPAIDDAGIKTIFSNNPEDFGATDGDMVKVKITDYDAEHLDVEMTDLLVKSTDVGADISKIIVSENAPLNFPSVVLEEAMKVKQHVLPKELDGRKDFRDHLIVTIDGADALDFDDAVEIERIENGYRIGVHIADVSHYVKENSVIDGEAFERGTSIYVADRVVPMLPTELSNGICSLNPEVDRLTMSVVMDVDVRGNTYRTELSQGVIQSKARLTYKEVNDFLAGAESDLDDEIKEMLNLLADASRKIRKRREQNGAMRLESTELKFTLDQYGHPLEVERRVQGQGEKMIEDLMIIANVAVANAFTEKGIPSLYRIHENPPTAKIEALKDFLKRSKLSKDFPANITPKALDYWLSGITDPGQHKVASNMLLRSLAKAKYSPDNAGHFGLGEEDYLHFTSPIRRYPDLLVHRLVKRYLLEDHLISTSLGNYLEEAGTHLSETERRAQVIERAVDDLETAKYMSKHLGDTFIGTISTLMPFGMFMELDNGIEALLPHDLIDEDTYIHDPVNFRTAGVETRRWFNIGSTVAVRAYSVDLERRQVNVATEEYYLAQVEREKNEGLSSADRQQSFGRKTYKKESGGFKRSYGSSESRDYKKHDSSYPERRSSAGKQSGYRNERSSGDGYKSQRSFSSERNSKTGDGYKKNYGERKVYGERKDYNKGDNAASYSKNRSSGSYKNSSDRRPYDNRSENDYKSKRSFSGEKKTFGTKDNFKKSYGDKKPYGERSDSSRSYGSRNDYRGQKSYGDKKFGDKKSSISSHGEGKTYAGSKSYDNKPRSSYGGSKKFVNSSRSSYGKKGNR